MLLGDIITLCNYRIAGKFGGELNLAVYITTAKLKSTKINISGYTVLRYDHYQLMVSTLTLLIFGKGRHMYMSMNVQVHVHVYVEEY